MNMDNLKDPLNMGVIKAYYKRKLIPILGHYPNYYAIKNNIYHICRSVLEPTNDDYELGIYHNKSLINKNGVIHNCSRCKIEYLININNTFCPRCNEIRFLYDSKELKSFINEHNNETKFGYITLKTDDAEYPIFIGRFLYDGIIDEIIRRLRSYLEEEIKNYK